MTTAPAGHPSSHDLPEWHGVLLAMLFSAWQVCLCIVCSYIKQGPTTQHLSPGKARLVQQHGRDAEVAGKRCQPWRPAKAHLSVHTCPQRSASGGPQKPAAGQPLGAHLCQRGRGARAEAGRGGVQHQVVLQVLPVLRPLVAALVPAAGGLLRRAAWRAAGDREPAAESTGLRTWRASR